MLDWGKAPALFLHLELPGGLKLRLNFTLKRGCPNIKIWCSEVFKNLYSSGFGSADSQGDTADLGQQGGGHGASDQEHFGGRSDCGCSSTSKLGCWSSTHLQVPREFQQAAGEVATHLQGCCSCVLGE